MENKCKICGLKPKFLRERYQRYESSIEIITGNLTSVRVAKDRNDRVFIYASGDCYTDNYYPNYCPECGRKLKEKE